MMLACAALTALMLDTANIERRIVAGSVADELSDLIPTPDEVAVVVFFRRHLADEMRFFDRDGCEIASGEIDPLFVESLMRQLGWFV